MPAPGRVGEPLSTPYGVNESVELVVDLLAATKLVPEDKLALARGRAQQTRSLAAALVEEGVASSEGIAQDARGAAPAAARRPCNLTGVDEERLESCRCTFSSASSRSRTPSGTDGCRSRSPTRRTCTASTSSGSRRAIRSSSASASREDILGAIRKLVRASEAYGARAAVDEEEEMLAAPRRTRISPTSRPTTASRMPRSSGSSTRSSSRPPRTAPPTSTSSRRRTRSSSASASTACCRRCSASRSG